MAKKYRIKDIAALAEVSAGTVDRVIHNRGDVSSESRKKVEKVLAEINYFYNTYIPSAKNEKRFKILAILPQHSDGEYWDSIEKGIESGIRSFMNVQLKIKFLYYDQFDLYSCRKVFHEAISLKADAVIIGPSFYDETVLFANQLFMNNTPYVFVDTWVNNTQPLAFFGPHSFQTGVVQARLLTTVLETGKDIAIFQAKRIGDETSIQSLARSYGFISYLKDHYPHINVYSTLYDNANKNESHVLIDRFFQEHANIGGAAVFDTKAHHISEYLKERNIASVKLIGYGTNKKNAIDLKDGFISFLISERPEYQGYAALRATVDYLLYNKVGEVENFTPIDILIKETIDFYTVN